MSELNSINDILLDVSTMGAYGVSIAWLARLLWRRISKDKSETVKDRAEINIIELMQRQIATLSEENQRLRNNEAELSIRLGRLEAKEKEVEDYIVKIERLQVRLEEKDIKIENIIVQHTKETTRMSMDLERKDLKIIQLTGRIDELEKRMK